MATYEFECKDCGTRFQVTSPMAEHDRLKERPPECPKCRKTNTAQCVTLFSCKTSSGA